MPTGHHSPDGGLDIDIFEPRYAFTPIFVIDPNLRARLVFEYWQQKSCLYPNAYSAAIRLAFEPARPTQIRDWSWDEFPYTGIFLEARARHTFPTRKVLQSGALRRPLGDMAEISGDPHETADGIFSASFSWSLALRSSSSEGAAPPVRPERPALPWANWIHQVLPLPLNPQSEAHVDRDDVPQTSAGISGPRKSRVFSELFQAVTVTIGEHFVPIYPPLRTSITRPQDLQAGSDSRASDLSGLWYVCFNASS